MCEKNLTTFLWDFLWCPGGDPDDGDQISWFTQLSCPGTTCSGPDGGWCCPTTAKDKWQCNARQLDLTENSCNAVSGCTCVDDTAYITQLELISMPRIIAEKTITSNACC